MPKTPTNKMSITYIEQRYVDYPKLDALLQSLFGQKYSVMVSAAFGHGTVNHTNAIQNFGDTISIEAQRELTEVRPLIPHGSPIKSFKPWHRTRKPL
jgi:hypothetical protein